MTIYTSPDTIPESDNFKLFLGGSIDMGKATNWQKKVCARLNDTKIDILNPRRDSFSIDDEKIVEEQINWELNAIEVADMVIFYFENKTKSPITLLELGLAHRKPCVVCCNTEYWRYKNVELTCKRYEIPFLTEKETLLEKIEEFIKTKI